MCTHISLHFRCSVCKPGYWGNTCQYTCSKNCVVNGNNNECAITDGDCALGCITGYWKPDCTGVCGNCADDRCIEITGKSSSIINNLSRIVLASSTGGPGFNPQSRTASYQIR